MKRIILLFLLLLLFGCSLNKKSPYITVSKYFTSYQNLDTKALNNINNLVENEKTLNNTQKEKYREILKNHYKNLNYKIKKVKIINNKATVSTEIEVNNNIKILKKTNYLKNDFIKNNNDFSIEQFNDYKIDMLRREKSKIKYKILFTLHIENNDWIIDNLNLINQEKMLGIYNDI